MIDTKKFNNSKKQFSYLMFYGLIFIGVIGVLYFSWISSPRLEYNNLVPSSIAKWADKYENMNLRTIVPFILISTLSGIVLILKNSNTKFWIFIWFLLIILVLVAELGQVFIPSRYFDKGDIKFGIVGSTIGLIVMYVLFLLFKFSKKLNKI